MRAGVQALLKADAAVAALAGARVYWGPRLQGQAGAAVCLHMIGETPQLALGGPTGFVTSRFQADCWAASVDAAVALAATVTTALHGYAGTQAGTVFHVVMQDGGRDFLTADAEDAAPAYRVALDFTAQHRSA